MTDKLTDDQLRKLHSTQAWLNDIASTGSLYAGGRALDALAVLDTLVRRAADAQAEREVAIKPLRWVKTGKGDTREEAKCVLGLYRLALSNITGKWRWSFNALDTPWSLELPTYEAAKAAAQADYEARIRSALYTAPQPEPAPARVQATNQLLRQLKNCADKPMRNMETFAGICREAHDVIAALTLPDDARDKAAPSPEVVELIEAARAMASYVGNSRVPQTVADAALQVVVTGGPILERLNRALAATMGGK